MAVVRQLLITRWVAANTTGKRYTLLTGKKKKKKKARSFQIKLYIQQTSQTCFIDQKTVYEFALVTQKLGARKTSVYCVYCKYK